MTGHENERQHYRHENHYQEDEVGLIDLLRVIWKWKWLIIAGVVLFIVAAAVISFQMKKIYEVSLFIEPGIIGIRENGGFVFMDSSENLSNKISEGVYNRNLKEMLSEDQLKNDIEFKSKPIKGGNLIKITSRWEEGKTDLGIKAFQQLLNLVTDDYEKVIQSMKDNYEKRIIVTQKRVESLKSELKIQEEMYENLKQRKKELLGEIRRVQNNMGKIVQQKNSYKKSDEDSSYFLILHSMTIQQNVVYSQLTDQLRDLENREKGIESESVNLKKYIDDAQNEVNELQFKKGMISNIKIVQQPEVSLNPVAPKKIQIIFLAGVASLFMFIFLAFFIEYIRNAQSLKKTE